MFGRTIRNKYKSKKRIYIKTTNDIREISDIKTDNKKSNLYPTQSNKLYEGLKMQCKYRGVVEVSRIETDCFYVKHINIEYKQNYSDIGVILFPYDDSLQKKSSEKQCSDCARIINGDCIGGSATCEYFVHGVKIEREVVENWPKYGTASSNRYKDQKDQVY